MRTSNQNEIDQLLSKDVSCSPSNSEKGMGGIGRQTPMVPTVHLNGTSKSELLAQNVNTPSEYLLRPLRTVEEAKAEIVRRHAQELNALIRQADDSFALKIDDARNHYQFLLRKLSWDHQKEQRHHDFVLYCEETWGDLGEMIAYRIICERSAA